LECGTRSRIILKKIWRTRIDIIEEKRYIENDKR